MNADETQVMGWIKYEKGERKFWGTIARISERKINNIWIRFLAIDFGNKKRWKV